MVRSKGKLRYDAGDYEMIRRLLSHVLSFPEYVFSASLNSNERCYVHRVAQEMGLKTKSRGKGMARYVTVYKPDGSSVMKSEALLGLTPGSKQLAVNLLKQYGVSSKEQQDLLSHEAHRKRQPCAMVGGIER